MQKAVPTTQKHELRSLRGPFVEAAMYAAYRRLLRDVLEIDVDDAPSETWTCFARFAPDGRCVANVEVAPLGLTLDGARTLAFGVRSVAVALDWRGRGLFRDLMTEALAWCEAHSPPPKPAGRTLLYTETPALYEPFGFQCVPQHAFVGPAPTPVPGAPARTLDLAQAADRAIVRDLLGRRTALSSRCALDVDAALFLANVAKDESLAVAYLAAPGALIVYEAEADGLVLADIVAPAIPSLATVLGALGLRPDRVKTLFPPEQLHWNGAAEREDTGLMMRGTISPAMTRPFMFPPTVEF